MIASPFGPVPLSQVARVTPTSTRYAVKHDGGQRFVSVTFNVTGSLQAVSQAAQARVAGLKLPQGAYVEFSGAAEAQKAAQGQMLLYTGFAFVKFFNGRQLCDCVAGAGADSQECCRP